MHHLQEVQSPFSCVNISRIPHIQIDQDKIMWLPILLLRNCGISQMIIQTAQPRDPFYPQQNYPTP
jgi:hypothetical protein